MGKTARVKIISKIKVDTFWQKAREAAGLTQREVSDILGYTTPQFVSNVERGRCTYPPEKVKTIAKLYMVKPENVLAAVTRFKTSRLSARAGV